MMHEPGKSDRPIVPQNPANNGRAKPLLAEREEGRGLAKEKAAPAPQADRTQRRVGSNPEDLHQALERIRQAARRDKELKFTSLWHHVYNVDRLREAYQGLSPHAAPGEDRVTWQQYGRELEANLQNLSGRLARGVYRAKPVKRVYIPKMDGRQRPIGIPVLEDKIVQRATVQVLNAVYETDFLGFSYGFRPGRSQHNALDALTVAIQRKKVSYVLDADIRGFFDALDHEWLVKFIEHRIADPRVIRHVKKWLNAGVLEQGKLTEQKEGVPQGGSVSPLLANVYLHYAFDLWVEQWRHSQACGDVIAEWALFCDKVLGAPDLARDPRFDSNAARSANRKQLAPILQLRLAQLNAAELIALLDGASIANASVNAVEGLREHPQLRARELWTEVASPAGPLPALRPPPLTDAYTQTMGDIPALGAHTDSVLAWLGYGASEIAALRTDGLI